MTIGHMSDTALQKLLDTLQTAAQHSHASRVRPTVSLAAECCEEQDGGTRILGVVQSTRLRSRLLPCAAGCTKAESSSVVAVAAYTSMRP